MNNKNALKDIDQKTFKINLKKAVVKAEVNQLYVDNKKMTNRFFFQIWHEDCFDHEFNFIGDSYFGIVKYDASDYLLWLKNGQLRRTNLLTFMRLNRLNIFDLDPDRIENWKRSNRYFARHLQLIDQKDNKEKLPEIPRKEIEIMIKNCKDFYQEIKEYKIFLK